MDGEVVTVGVGDACASGSQVVDGKIGAVPPVGIAFGEKPLGGTGVKNDSVGRCFLQLKASAAKTVLAGI